MNHVLFIQGGGEKGYEADEKLVNSLRRALDDSYKVYYPRMNTDESLPDFGWLQQIENEIMASSDGIILVGHSLGASFLLKYLSEKEVKNTIKGIFLISTPFWSGNADWIQGLKLNEDFNDKLSKDLPIFMYHCRDDDTIPFSNFIHFKSELSWVTFCAFEQGGHQLNNDLSLIAKDIKSFILTNK